MTPVGSALGTDDILELAGKGGIGEVYRTRDTRPRRDVAIKLLPPITAILNWTTLLKRPQ